MEKIGIISFNSACQTEKMKKSNIIEIINLNVEVGEESFVDKTIDELSQKVEEIKELPKTSQPATGQYLEKYQEMLQKYEHILVLTPDKQLSGTHQNAVLSCDMMEEEEQKRIHIIHTTSFALSESYICDEALDLIAQNMEIEEIIPKLTNMAKKITTYIIPGNFEYLKMSGRVNLTQLLIGKLISLKLLLKHQNGEAIVIGKSRGYKKILNEIEKILTTHKITKIYLGHLIPNEEELKALKEMLEKYAEVIEAQYPSVIMASHLGPKTLGYMIVEE